MRKVTGDFQSSIHDRSPSPPHLETFYPGGPALAVGFLHVADGPS